MPSCPNCGKETSTGAAFCPSCGASFTAVPPSQSQSVASPPPAVVEIPISYIVQTTTIPFESKASRIELLVRIVWYILTWLVGVVYSIIFGIIILIYGIIALILNIINFFIILITGKRWKTAFDWQAKLIAQSATYSTRLYNYWMRRAPYLGLMTDKRPDLGMEPEPSKTPGGSPA
ncbi:MAG: zinc-ribbon domain-containing protein [Candidatus Bathyarchaeia archaeon]